MDLMKIIYYVSYHIIFGELNFSLLSALLRLLCLFLSGIFSVLISLVLKFQSVLQFKRQIQINIIPGHLFWLK